jgi:hemolysin III
VAVAAELPVSTTDRIRPWFRGWLHAGVTPIATVAAVLLVIAASRGRAAVVIYGVGVVSVFGVSAIYHRLAWNTRHRSWWQRADHSTIFVFIASTCTPFAVLGGQPGWSLTVLGLVWAGAIAGVVVIWTVGIRPVLGALYMTLGWMGLLLVPQLLATAGVATVVLLSVGGVCYTLGALASLTNRPNPWPSVFGYHEVFHLLTIAAAVCQYSAVLIATTAHS